MTRRQDHFFIYKYVHELRKEQDAEISSAMEAPADSTTADGGYWSLGSVPDSHRYSYLCCRWGTSDWSYRYGERDQIRHYDRFGRQVFHTDSNRAVACHLVHRL